MNTCGQCSFFRVFHGERQGYCYGNPPAVFANGFQQPNPPKVKTDHPECSLFRGLPPGTETLVREKVQPETPGDAIKQKRQEQQGRRKR